MRLRATKAIFNGRLQTTYNLLVKTDAQITRDYHDLNIIRGRILRASRPQTLERIRQDLSDMADVMGHAQPTSAGKQYLLNKINVYKQQNSYLRYAAIDQAITNICVIYEDFIKRIILKYYEENILRIPANKESLKNKVLVEAILRGDNIHRTLAEKVVDDLMYGSIEAWYDTLKNQKMSLTISPHLVELFLVRNCIVHNNNRVSTQLHQMMPHKHTLRKTIKLTVTDVKFFKDEVHKSAIFIMSEYNRLHPINRGTWL